MSLVQFGVVEKMKNGRRRGKRKRKMEEEEGKGKGKRAEINFYRQI